jgi:hypothetical protein
MNSKFPANELTRATRDVGDSVSPTGEAAAIKDEYMNNVQGLK